MNCTELDMAVSDIHTLYLEEDAAFAVVCVASVIISGLFVVQGEELMRPLAAISGGLGATAATFVLSSLFFDDCNVRLVASGIAGVMAAILALCILKSGLFILGAAGFGAITHLVYDALPLEDVSPPFTLLGRSGYYYIAMGVAVFSGAIIAWCQKKPFVRITSSLIGGAGLSFTTWIVAERAGERLPSVALLAILVASVVVGVPTQKYTKQYREKRRTRKRAEKKYESS